MKKISPEISNGGVIIEDYMIPEITDEKGAIHWFVEFLKTYSFSLFQPRASKIKVVSDRDPRLHVTHPSSPDLNIMDEDEILKIGKTEKLGSIFVWIEYRGSFIGLYLGLANKKHEFPFMTLFFIDGEEKEEIFIDFKEKAGFERSGKECSDAL